MSDTTKVSRRRPRLSHHVRSTVVVAVLAAALLAGTAARTGAPAATGDAVPISTGSAAQVAACVEATNSEHAEAGRATSWLIFVWANGSGDYLGLLWSTTSLREESTGVWTMVDTCDDDPPPPPETGWPHVGLDLPNTRAATAETSVGTDDVETLGRVWELADVSGVTGTPIVSDGVLYVGDWTGHLRALDAASGEAVWSAEVGSQIPGAVALDDARVFAGTWDGDLVAHDRASGAEVWSVPVDDHDVAVVYGSPVHVDGLVIVGVASDEWWEGDGFTFRGSVIAFDAETGDEVWRYWTSCGAENAGQDNCAGATEDEGAGVGVWAYPAVDAERGLVYFGTGNHYGPPATGRSDALIAVDLETGEEAWVHQFTPGDVWNLPGQGDPDVEVGPDADVMVASLFEVGDVDTVGVGDKAGTYKALDRETGEELWSQELTDGSIQGGVMASAAVVDGERAGRDDDVLYLTSNRGGVAADLIALDTADGSVIERTDVGGSVVSPVTWANGVIYVADNTGRFSAFDGDGLERLWSWEVDNSAAGGISVVEGIVYGGWGWALDGNSPGGGLLAFGLDGEPPDGGGGEDPDGAEIYQDNCAACHGADGSGGSGPSLLGVAGHHSIEELIDIVANGRAGMPAWEGVLSPEEIEAVVDYVATFEGDHEH